MFHRDIMRSNIHTVKEEDWDNDTGVISPATSRIDGNLVVQLHHRPSSLHVHAHYSTHSRRGYRVCLLQRLNSKAVRELVFYLIFYLSHKQVALYSAMRVAAKRTRLGLMLLMASNLAFTVSL